MATGSLISVREYLSTTYRPDCDYVDGVVVERNLGEYDHSRLQGELVYYFRARREKWTLGHPRTTGSSLTHALPYPRCLRGHRQARGTNLPYSPPHLL